MHDHILIIGGTGMLKSASIILAGRCKLLTSIAGTLESLTALDEDIAALKTHHQQLALDWNSPGFLSSIANHIEKQGCPTLVVAWLHNNALGPDLASALSMQCNSEISFFQIEGSASADPTINVCSASESLPVNVKFHRIILGFEVENGNSRWLANPEISAGVISAIDGNKECSIVGKISPWTARP